MTDCHKLSRMANMKPVIIFTQVPVNTYLLHVKKVLNIQTKESVTDIMYVEMVHWKESSVCLVRYLTRLHRHVLQEDQMIVTLSVGLQHSLQQQKLGKLLMN